LRESSREIVDFGRPIACAIAQLIGSGDCGVGAQVRRAGPQGPAARLSSAVAAQMNCREVPEVRAVLFVSGQLLSLFNGAICNRLVNFTESQK
jgi:hypothetical protein